MSTSVQTMVHPILGIRLGIAKAGIRYPDRDDLVLIEINEGATVAGVFTQNAFCAAPVQVCKKHLKEATPRALIINTGNANAATGENGIIDALATAQGLSDLLQISPNQVLPFSTGVIGEPLPMKPLIKGLPKTFANLAANNWEAAARGIMTTDTRPKCASRQFKNGDEMVHITGIAKGSGMIQPNMATMLSFIATDAKIAPNLLNHCLKTATNASFNCITVDSDTSTNDSVILIATGAGSVIVDDQNCEDFMKELQAIMIELAQSIVKDGEGATKFITVTVNKGLDVTECKQVAFSIANSPLIKTALFASDPNWGRIVMAIGKSGITDLNQNNIDIKINDLKIVTHGVRDPHYQESMGANALAKKDIVIKVRLNRGDASATVWTCDFSYDYVKINADYRS